jgi:hypothetical protein
MNREPRMLGRFDTARCLFQGDITHRFLALLLHAVASGNLVSLRERLLEAAEVADKSGRMQEFHRLSLELRR